MAVIAPNRSDFLTPDGRPTLRFIRWIEALTLQGNNSTTVIETGGSVTGIFSGYPSHDSVKDLALSVSADYTTTGAENIVICTDAVTVTLNATPKDLERVSIKRSTDNGTVTVSGTIDGVSSHSLFYNYDCIDLIYSVDSGGWLII